MSSISACNSHFPSLLSLPILFQETQLRKPSLFHYSIKSCNSFTSLRFRFLPSSFKTHIKNGFPKTGVVFVDQSTEWIRPDEDSEVEKRVFDWGQQEEVSDGVEEEEYAEPSEEAKIFVGNLPFDVDSEKLAHIFDKAGIVEVSEVIYKRGTDQSRGFGFVTMSSVEEAEKAVEMFNRYDIGGRLLTVNKAASRASQPLQTRGDFGPSFRIYVGNLPWQVDDARLQQVFSEHGKVVNARVVSDRESGRSRGFGFVTMSTKNELDDAVAALDGQILDGRSIRVSIAEARPRLSF